MNRQRECQYLKAGGEPCRAQALPGRTSCIFHDPDLAAKRAEGRKRGGTVRSKPAAVLPRSTPDLPLRTVADIAAMLGTTINQVRRGELDPKVGNCLAVLSGQLLRALEGGELAQRLDALEARLAGPGPHPAGTLNGIAGRGGL
jgi:hypothetical protein